MTEALATPDQVQKLTTSIHRLTSSEGIEIPGPGEAKFIWSVPTPLHLPPEILFRLDLPADDTTDYYPSTIYNQNGYAANGTPLAIVDFSIGRKADQIRPQDAIRYQVQDLYGGLILSRHATGEPAELNDIDERVNAKESEANVQRIIDDPTFDLDGEPDADFVMRTMGHLLGPIHDRVHQQLEAQQAAKQLEIEMGVANVYADEAESLQGLVDSWLS